jgi:hypothetical protein
MTSSLEKSPTSGAGRKAATWGLVSLAAALCLTGFSAAPASAQFFEYYYDDQPYPEAAYPLYPERPAYRDYPVSPGPRGGATISLADVRQRVAQRGMHLVATPRRKGRIYLAETEDGRGVRHRLVFDAFDGHLLENTVLGAKPTASPAPRASAETGEKAAAERAKEKLPVRSDEPPPPDDPGGPTR